MPEYADLEISLHRREGATYSVELRFSRPDSEADQRFEPAQAQFDFDALRALELDLDGYGKELSAKLFAEAGAQSALAQARAVTEAQALGLRLRLNIGPSAPELQALYWEVLRDPQSGDALGTDENLLFSRYLSSMDWRPVRLRPQSALTALVAIANPKDLERLKLAPVDEARELQRAHKSLDPIAVTALPNATARATLNNLIDHLRATQPDIWYLAAHGLLRKGEAWVMLETETGETARVSGDELVTRLKELPHRPRLIVLASCQSAGAGNTDTLAALGPQLAQAGIPAVLAMQGSVSMAMIERFMPKFFEELNADGQIDRALAVARGTVRDLPDYWMPALYTRLKSGRIWYVPGFKGGGGDGEEFEYWESLKTFIQEKRCTPILGPGIDEAWLGQPGDIARRWAEKYHYPFAAHELENLATVAQFLSRRDGAKALQSAFNKAIRDEIVQRYRTALPPDLVKAEVWPADKLLKALETIATAHWAQPGAYAHKQLADLALPIYLTTSPSNLLALALKAKGVDPQVRLCPWWSQRIPEAKWRYEDEPTEEKPLVYHLFGHFNTPESLVLSEDNYFDFLIGVARNKTLIPDTVVNALTNSALLFVGFRPDDWDYRVLYRTLMAQEGSEQLRDYRHVTAQVEPDESRLLDIQRARRFLEKAFNKDNIGMFWGRSEDFLSALTQQLKA